LKSPRPSGWRWWRVAERRLGVGRTLSHLAENTHDGRRGPDCIPQSNCRRTCPKPRGGIGAERSACAWGSAQVELRTTRAACGLHAVAGRAHRGCVAPRGSCSTGVAGGGHRGYFGGLTEVALARLVVRTSVENPGWGYTRVRGALRSLGHELGRSTTRRILADAGIEPAPERSKRTPWAT